MTYLSLLQGAAARGEGLPQKDAQTQEAYGHKRGSQTVTYLQGCPMALIKSLYSVAMQNHSCWVFALA